MVLKVFMSRAIESGFRKKRGRGKEREITDFLNLLISNQDRGKEGKKEKGWKVTSILTV